MILRKTALMKALFLAAVAFVATTPRAHADSPCPVVNGDIDGNGTQDIAIKGNTLSVQNLVINISQTSTDVFLDCNGNGSFTNALAGDLNVVGGPALETINVTLVDNVRVNIIGPLTGVTRNLQFLACYNVVIDGSRGSLAGNSHVVIANRGNVSNDYFTVHLPATMDASEIDIRGEMGDGNDRFFLIADGVMTNGSVVDAVGAMGNNANVVTLTQTGVIDNSRLNLDAQGGPGLDFFTFDLKGQVINNGRLLVRAQGGDLTDTIKANVDLTTFKILTGGEVRLDLRGDAGTDFISVTRNNTVATPTTEIQGVLDLNIDGGYGADRINVDLAGGGFVLDGTLRMRVDGNEGNDTITVATDVQAASLNPVINAQVHGGFGVDKITMAINNQGPNAAANYAPAGVVLLDGGYSPLDTCVIGATNTAPIHKRNCEQ
jgi:hypothetical protein